jgi:hypothetical protein
VIDKDESNWDILERLWAEYKVDSNSGPVGVGNFEPKDKQNTVFIKTHTYTNPKVEQSNLVNFSLNPALLDVALREFPSSYDPIKGPWTDEYANSRNEFLSSQKWKKSKRDDKK